MNPYEILDVPETASAAQIKSAYRKRAKQTHPDAVDGDGDEFAKVSYAYGILINPESRKKFDETGSLDEVAPLTVRQRMIQILAGMFNQALNAESEKGTSFKHFDLIEAMRANMKVNLDTVRANRDKFRRRLADRKVLLKRIVRQTDGENVFANIIRQQLPEFERVLKAAELDYLAMELVVDELINYKSEIELIQAVQMMQFGGTYGATSTTGNGVFRVFG